MHHAPRQARLVALAVALVVLAIPSAASAASLGVTDWTLRASWVNYVKNPLWAGTITASPTWTGPTADNTYGVPVDAAASTATVRQHTGQIRFRVPAHSVDVTFANLRLARSGTDVTVHADATYTPLGGSPVSDNRDVFTFDLPSTGGGTFNDRTAFLTARGAEVFNGGPNGSYHEGDPWGDFSVAFP